MTRCTFRRWPMRVLRMVLLLALAPISEAAANEEFSAAFDKAKSLADKADHAAAAREYELALEIAERVFGSQAEDTAIVLNNLAFAYNDLGQYAKAEPLYLRSINIRDNGPNAETSFNLAVTLDNLAVMYLSRGRYAEAEPLFERSLKIREASRGPDDLAVAYALNRLARLYGDLGRYAEAEPLYQRSLQIREAKLGEDDPDVAMALSNLACLYTDAARYTEAEPLYQRSLAIREARLGADHLDVAQSLNNLAFLYKLTAKYTEAEPLYQRSLAIREAKLGADHLDVAQGLNNLAFLYHRTAKYGNAEPLHRRALRILEDRLGPDHPDVALSLNGLAEIYRKTARYEEAEPLYQRSLGIYEATFGAEHRDVALVLNNLARLYDQTGQYTKAQSLYERSLRIKEACFGPEHLDVALALSNLACLYGATGQYAKAEPLYERSLKIKEAKLGPEHPDVAIALNNLAGLCSDMGQYERAEPLYQRSLKIREAKLGPEHPDTGLALSNLAYFYDNMGLYDKAEPLCQRSLKIREACLGPEHPDVALSLNNLASLYSEMGQYAKAEPLYQRSLRIRETKLGAEHPDVAQSLNNLADLYEDMGQYAQAEPLHLRSLKIKEAKFGPEHPDVALALNNLAHLYQAVRQYAKAETLYQRSLKIREAMLGPEHPDVASTLNNLALLYDDMGQQAKAEPLYRRSLKISETRLGPDDLSVARTLDNLACLYEDMGRFSESEALHQQCLKIREARLGPDHRDVATTLNNLACLYDNLGRHAEAEQFYLRCLKIEEEQLGPDHPRVAVTYANLADCYKRNNDDAKAAQQQDFSRRIVRKHVVRVLPILSSQEQLTFVERSDRGPFHVSLTLGWLSANAALAEQSAGWLVNGKAVIQESLAQQTRLARDSQDPELAQRTERLSAVRSELAGLSLAKAEAMHDAGHRKRLAELALEEQELLRELNVAAGRPDFDDPWVEIADVRKALAADAVLIDVARFEPFAFEAKRNESKWKPARYAAWVVPATGKGDVRIVDLGAADEVDRAVETSRRAIQHSGERLTRRHDEGRAEGEALEPLTALARLVLKPLLPAIGDAKELVISPDSQLWLVPWAALPIEEGEYAIERWSIRFVTSGRDVALEALASAKTHPSTKPRIFADPDYNLDGARSAAATRAVLRGQEEQLALRGGVGLPQSGLPQVERLPATADEARWIMPALTALTHESPTLYSQQYALEGVLKMVASPRVLVVSTHGFCLAEEPVDTFLENPLLRCGLFLAGCNQRQKDTRLDDGVLTGMEIVGCDLRGTELVVLSACETGLGEVQNGEGVAGLRQAFQLAGARSVVSSLWRVSDQETARLISLFFNGLAEGKSKSDAMRAAQLAAIRDRRYASSAAHPFFWAAFTLTGS
ncbi:MAG TPA: tetratricopeptide repeat protein [Pirellulales bacterium]|nr:tetratricopeptide repeat protein [Pirellulales bacterium]